jgi:hypothetical protein
MSHDHDRMAEDQCRVYHDRATKLDFKLGLNGVDKERLGKVADSRNGFGDSEDELARPGRARPIKFPKSTDNWGRTRGETSVLYPGIRWKIDSFGWVCVVAGCSHVFQTGNRCHLGN